MGKNIPANSSLGIDFFSIFFVFFFFKANMNLTVFAGILLAVTMVTARRASLVEKTKQAAAEAEEPDEAKRESGMETCSNLYCSAECFAAQCSDECCDGMSCRSLLLGFQQIQTYVCVKK